MLIGEETVVQRGFLCSEGFLKRPPEKSTREGPQVVQGLSTGGGGQPDVGEVVVEPTPRQRMTAAMRRYPHRAEEIAEAHRVLDRAELGLAVSERQITQALWVTGDLSGV